MAFQAPAGNRQQQLVRMGVGGLVGGEGFWVGAPVRGRATRRVSPQRAPRRQLRQTTTTRRCRRSRRRCPQPHAFVQRHLREAACSGDRGCAYVAREPPLSLKGVPSSGNSSGSLSEGGVPSPPLASSFISTCSTPGTDRRGCGCWVADWPLLKRFVSWRYADGMVRHRQPAARR